MQYTDIGIDLGTASILVYIRGKGVVLKEPSVVAFDRDTNKIKAIGEDARLMLGRTPGNIVAVRPLRQGVISDYTVTEKMMKYFIQKALGRKTFRRPRIAVCVPSGVTELDIDSLKDADKKLFKLICSLGEIRSKSEAIKHGTYNPIIIKNEQFIFLRKFKDEEIYVALNLDDKAVEVIDRSGEKVGSTHAAYCNNSERNDIF